MSINARPIMRHLVCVVVLLLGTQSASYALSTAEPYACLSTNPHDWPACSKPYFLVVADTSSSMTSVTIPTPNPCGYANTQSGHEKCALRNMFMGLTGVANFGLATFAVQQQGCDA